MHISKLHVKSFRGLNKHVIELDKGLNILHGRRCSGKTSIVDSLLFLQRFIISPSRRLEALLHTWFTLAIVHKGGNKFSIAIKTLGRETERGIFGIIGDLKENSIQEFYAVGDTLISMKTGQMEISNILLSREDFIEELRDEIEENVWNRVSRKKLRYEKVPWTTITGLIWGEITHYGFDIAYKNIPEAIATILLKRAKDLSKEEKDLLKPRIVSVLKYAFKINRFLRRSVVAKHIDYKNAIGPSKLRGYTIDPHFSNLPWILYNIYRGDEHKDILQCLSEMGVHDMLHGIERTVDHRYYIIASSRGTEIIREGIASSFIKALALCTAIKYAENLVVIDDFDEYLDEELSLNFLKIAGNVRKQVILTTRHRIEYGELKDKIHIVDISAG